LLAKPIEKSSNVKFQLIYLQKKQIYVKKLDFFSFVSKFEHLTKKSNQNNHE